MPKKFSEHKLSNDWKHIKQNTGWDHFVNYIKEHDFGLPHVDLAKDGGANLHGIQGKSSRDVTWVDIEWLLDVIGALKVGPPNTFPGVADVHTPDTFVKKIMR